MFRTKNTPIDHVSDEALEALRRTFTDEEIGHLSELATVLQVDAGTELAIEGSRGSQAFVLVGGSVSVSRGGEHIAHSGPGDIVGEIALLTDEPRTATVVTTEPTKLYAMTPREFASLLDRCPRLESKVATTAIRRLSVA